MDNRTCNRLERFECVLDLSSLTIRQFFCLFLTPLPLYELGELRAGDRSTCLFDVMAPRGVFPYVWAICTLGARDLSLLLSELIIYLCGNVVNVLGFTGIFGH